MALTIRKAKASDVSVLVSLWRELADHGASFGKRDRKLAPHLVRGREADRRFAVLARKNIGSRKGVVYLAEVDGAPAGYVFALIKVNPWNLTVKRFGYIDHLLVKKEFRGQGISSSLNREVISWLRSKGIRHLSLHVLEPNRDAQAIYRKWGFFPLVVEMRKNL